MRAVVLSRAAWVLALFIWTSVAQAAPDPREMKAREAFAAGRYQDALDIFVKLYAEKLHPNYLRNIGRCYQNLGEPDRAISSFREYLRKARRTSPAERAEIEGYIAEMEQLKTTQASKDSAGGKPAAASAPPGVAAAPSTPPPAAAVVVEREVAPRSTTQPALDLSARPAPDQEQGQQEARPVYTRWWFWAIVGGVIVAGVGGAAAAGLFTRKVDAPCDMGRICL
ncbi:MAG TPA: tetratricopeptide repeat protein [Polyangia bacterium]|nr:tetratricopeptide repeat protein [Polyangia bacterium]